MSLTLFILKRIGLGIITLFILSIIIFAAAQVLSELGADLDRAREQVIRLVQADESDLTFPIVLRPQILVVPRWSKLRLPAGRQLPGLS